MLSGSRARCRRCACVVLHTLRILFAPECVAPALPCDSMPWRTPRFAMGSRVEDKEGDEADAATPAVMWPAEAARRAEEGDPALDDATDAPPAPASAAAPPAVFASSCTSFC